MEILWPENTRHQGLACGQVIISPAWVLIHRLGLEKVKPKTNVSPISPLGTNGVFKLYRAWFFYLAKVSCDDYWDWFQAPLDCSWQLQLSQKKEHGTYDTLANPETGLPLLWQRTHQGALILSRLWMQLFILHCQGYAVRIIRQTRCPAPCRPPGTVLSQTVKLDWIPYACQLISFGKFLEYWIPNIFSLGKWVNTSDNLWQHCPGHGDWLRCWPDTHWPDQIYDQGASFYILCF